MNTITLKTIVIASTILFVSGCSTTPPVETVSKIQAPAPIESVNPDDWVFNTPKSDGITEVSCVPYSGNFSIDKKHATANGRAALAHRIESNIETMDKTYDDKVGLNDKAKHGSTFSSVSKQVSKQTLRSTSITKVKVLEIYNTPNLCILMTINDETTRLAFDDIIKSSNRVINKEQKDNLYLEFKAEKSQIELNKEIDELNKSVDKTDT